MSTIKNELLDIDACVSLVVARLRNMNNPMLEDMINDLSHIEDRLLNLAEQIESTGNN